MKIRCEFGGVTSAGGLTEHMNLRRGADGRRYDRFLTGCWLEPADILQW